MTLPSEGGCPQSSPHSTPDQTCPSGCPPSPQSCPSGKAPLAPPCPEAVAAPGGSPPARSAEAAGCQAGCSGQAAVLSPSTAGARAVLGPFRALAFRPSGLPWAHVCPCCLPPNLSAGGGCSGERAVQHQGSCRPLNQPGFRLWVLGRNNPQRERREGDGSGLHLASSFQP